MHRTSALPFTVRRSQDVIGKDGVTSTRETVYGLLRLAGDNLVVQWQVARQTERIGAEIRTDEEIDALKEVVVPLESVAGAVVRRRWRLWRRAFEIVLTGADLRAFEELTGVGGLRLAHPAELVLQLRRTDRVAAEEFGADLSLAVAELAAGVRAEDRVTLPGGATHLPGATKPGPEQGG